MKHHITLTLVLGVCFGTVFNSGKAEDNGLGPLPILGWTTWCTDDLCGLFDWCNETEVKSVAKAMASNGMKDAGWNLILLDDCWAGYRDSEGNLYADPSRFPSGMPALVDYVHDLGLLMGLYTCSGNLTCKFGRPGSLGHYEQDAQRFAEWNVDYVKMDNCGHPHEPPEEYFGNFSRALQSTGKPIWFNICGWGEDSPWTGWGANISNSFRIGQDHLPLWDLGLGLTGQGTANVIELLASVGSSEGCRSGGWCDPDFLEGGLPWFTFDERKTEFSIWSLMNAPLITATDVRPMSAEDKAVYLNTEIIAVNQDEAALPGERLWNQTNGLQLWRKLIFDRRGPVDSNKPYSWSPPRPINTDPSHFMNQAVVVYNSANVAQEVTVTWKDLGWPEGSVTVRDLWAHKVLGSDTSGFATGSIPPHGSVMWKVTRSSR